VLDGADEPCRPVLDEVPLEPDDLRALVPVCAAEVWWLAAACADPGRLAATPPAATRLARPAAAVTVRILARLRSLAAIDAGRAVGRGRMGSGGMGFLSD
jgi:hypothetical protein